MVPPQVVAELAAACADATSLFGAKLGALELAVNWGRWGKSIDGHKADYKYMTCQCNIYIYTYIYTYIYIYIYIHKGPYIFIYSM